MRILIALAFAATGCRGFSFQCAADGECVDQGSAGRCEDTGFCSFPDPACPSGSRYGEFAGNSLGNTCVGATAGPDAPVDPPIDAPPGSITASFGETGTATYSGVTIDTSFQDNEPVGVSTENHTSVDAGSTEVGLYRFDISVIPTTATVISAQLEVSTTGDGASFYSAGTAIVYRLKEQWTEAEAGFVNRSNVATWTNPGAEAPDSRDPVMLGSFTPTADLMRYPVDLPAAVVQGWVADPATNAGVIIETGTGVGHLHLGTKEGLPANAALLTVTYLP